MALEERLARIARTRADLGAAAEALHGDLSRRLDWRAWVRHHPLTATAVAAAAGWLLVSRLAAPARSRGIGRSLASLLASTTITALLPLVAERLGALLSSWTAPLGADDSGQN